MSDNNIEAIRASIEAALRRRHAPHSINVRWDCEGPVRSSRLTAVEVLVVPSGNSRATKHVGFSSTEADAHRALAVACGLRVEGDVVSDPAEEVERLRQELAVARAALREYAPRCAECDAVASRRVDGYEDKEALRCHECSPSPETHKWSHDVEHAAALRAAGDGR